MKLTHSFIVIWVCADVELISLQLPHSSLFPEISPTVESTRRPSAALHDRNFTCLYAFYHHAGATNILIFGKGDLGPEALRAFETACRYNR